MTVTTSQVATGDEAAALVSAGAQVRGRTPWEIFWTRFKRDRAALVGLVVIGVVIVLSLSAPLFSRYINHHGPNITYPNTQLNSFGVPKGPNGQFWFGVDPNARDLFVRILYGAQVSMVVAFLATGISVVLGTTVGLVAGYYRGWVDTVLSRFMDIMLAFPILLLALGLGEACQVGGGCLHGLVRPGLPVVVLIISIASFPYLGRIIRGQVLSIREKEFVEAAQSLGASDARIIRSEILPNIVAPIIVYASLIIPTNVLFEAALSFLGVGVSEPQASWGKMIGEAASTGAFSYAWWYFVFPGLFLFATVLAFNLVGDALRDALDPRTGR
jgi:peptide/nickel transport system permease protein